MLNRGELFHKKILGLATGKGQPAKVYSPLQVLSTTSEALDWRMNEEEASV